ncbi:MAG: PEGA domain-containing protein [Candidatus Brocadiia bacterium]
MKSNSGGSFFLVLAVTVLIAVALTGVAYWAGLIFPGPFALKLTSSPAGALVLFDGKPGGMTPLVLKDVKPGEHSFTFTMEGYRDQKMAKIFKAEETINAVLDPLPNGRISIVTEPDRATVFVDGVEKGETPISFPSTPGLHNLSIVKENFDEVLTTLEVKNGEEMPFQVKMTPSIETYYKRMMVAEPLNMGNYCDLIRFYYVKHRFEDMTNLIMTGYSTIADNKLRDDGAQRFNQEMKKVREDDRALFKKEILPLLVPMIADYVTKHPDSKGGEVLFSLLIDRDRAGEDWDVLLKVIVENPKAAPLRVVIAQIATLAARPFQRMNDADFVKIADAIFDSDKFITDKAQLFLIYSRFGDAAYIAKKKYDIAFKFYTKAVEVFPDNGKIDELNSVQVNLVRAMGYMKHYKEALAYIEKLMNDPRTTAAAKKSLATEKASIEAKMKPGASPAPTPSPKIKLK